MTDVTFLDFVKYLLTGLFAFAILHFLLFWFVRTASVAYHLGKLWALRYDAKREESKTTDR